MDLRYKSVIKFYNFIRSNKLAPLSVKLKVLRACVVNSLLHNCEDFGYIVPRDLESTYMKLIKCCLNIRTNVPNDIVFIESGLLPLKAVILVRQFKFYKERFFETVKKNSRRDRMLNMLLQNQNRTRYIQHYEDLVTRYESKKDIVNEYRNLLKQRIYAKANTGHYKYYIYTRINPELTTSPFLDVLHPIVGYVLKFRLGSHYLPIETGRWSGRPCHERLCDN